MSDERSLCSTHISIDQSESIISDIVRNLSAVSNWRYLWSLNHRLNYRPEHYLEARMRLATYCLLSMNNSPTAYAADNSNIHGSKIEHCLKLLVRELVLRRDRPVEIRSLTSTVIDSFVCKLRHVEDAAVRLSNQKIFIAFMSLLKQEDILITPPIQLSEQQYRFLQDSLQTTCFSASSDLCPDTLVTFIDSIFTKSHKAATSNLFR